MGGLSQLRPPYGAPSARGAAALRAGAGQPVLPRRQKWHAWPWILGVDPYAMPRPMVGQPACLTPLTCPGPDDGPLARSARCPIPGGVSLRGRLDRSQAGLAYQDPNRFNQVGRLKGRVMWVEAGMAPYAPRQPLGMDDLTSIRMGGKGGDFAGALAAFLPTFCST